MLLENICDSAAGKKSKKKYNQTLICKNHRIPLNFIRWLLKYDIGFPSNIFSIRPTSDTTIEIDMKKLYMDYFNSAYVGMILSSKYPDRTYSSNPFKMLPYEITMNIVKIAESIPY